MKNILSYKKPVFTGQEIMEWVEYHIQNNTSHSKEAKYILCHYKLIPNKKYYISTHYYGTGCGEKRYKPYIQNY